MEKFKKILKDNSGVTMAETLVAFGLLIIISLSFLAILQFSSRMTMEADDRRVLAQELDERLALTNPGFTPGSELSGKLVLKEKNVEPPATPATIILGKCGVDSLAYPAVDDPVVTVIRFSYDAGE